MTDAPAPAVRHLSDILRFLREHGNDPDADVVGTTYTKCGLIISRGRWGRVLPRPPARAPLCPDCKGQRLPADAPAG